MHFLGLKILSITFARALEGCMASSPASYPDKSVTGRLMEILSSNDQACNAITSVISSVKRKLGIGSYARLVYLMKTKLPAEIIDHIEQSVYQQVFCPGLIYIPRQRRYRKTAKWRGKSYFVARPELLTLSKAVHSKWQTRLWTDNTYILGKNTYSWLRKLKEGRDHGCPYSTVRLAHVVFTFRLYERGARIYRTDIQEDLGLFCDSCNRVIFPDHIRNRINGIILDSRSRWILELWRISRVLSPAKLTLDCTKCYMPDNRCLALEWLQQDGQQIHQYLPSEIEVIAADRATEARIMRLLRPARAG